MVSFKHHSPAPASPDITPLLDVVFILLIFFVVSTVFSAKGMDIELPSAESSKSVSGKSLEIQLCKDGSIVCDTQAMTLRSLSHKLHNIAEKPPAMHPAHILLKSAPQAQVENFIRIVDIVRTQGFSNLVIVTNSTNAKKKPAPDAGDYK